MKVTDILQGSRKAFPSLEFVPPLTGGDINVLYRTLEPLMEFRPPYVNITCHRDDRVDGKIVTRRPGTVAISAAVMHRFNIEVVPHVVCAYADKQELELELIDLHFLGIENLMALRGDTPGRVPFYTVENGYSHTDELIAQIMEKNKGVYLDKSIKGVPTNFCVGVAGYPEKHCEAPSLESDIAFLKRKVDAGAEYVITQMFFDNSRYFEFVRRCRVAGITVPIIPGLKPLANKGHLTKLPETFSIELPESLRLEAEKCKDDAAVRQLGIEWCVAQSRELIAAGAPAVHYYTMSRGANIAEVLKRVF